MPEKSIYQEDIKNIYSDIEDLKIEVAVMQERTQNQFKTLLEKIDSLCEKATQKESRNWGIKQSLVAGTGMIVIAGLFEIVKKHL